MSASIYKPIAFHNIYHLIRRYYKLKYKKYIMINVGPINIVQVLFNLIDLLVRKRVISSAEADNILKKSMDSNLSASEKEKALKDFKGG